MRDILYAYGRVRGLRCVLPDAPGTGIYKSAAAPPTAISLLECIDLLAEIFGHRPAVRFQPDRIGDLRYFVCDVAKARRELGWQARIAPADGVRRLVERIRENHHLFRKEGGS